MYISAAIPLTDPEFTLLPIHYHVDPGETFNWCTDIDDYGKCKQLELTTEQKLNLIRK